MGERRSTMKMVNNGENKKDLIELILEAKWENDEELKDKDVADMLLMLLFAGHETTAMAFTSSILYLTRHPQVFAKAKVLTSKLSFILTIMIFFLNKMYYFKL